MHFTQNNPARFVPILRFAAACLLLVQITACASPRTDTSINTQAAIASAHPLATQAGLKILQQGGNAFDAAVAVSAALAVVEPYSSGLGGGGFWLLHIAKDNHDVVIDGRERAPLAATRDMYLDSKGEVIPRASIDGPLSAGIPGEPAALAYIAKHYGRLPLSQSLQPAIQYARTGFEIGEHYRRLAQFRLDTLSANEAAASIFLKDDQVPDLHDRVIQADLAHTLELIAQQGAAGFYQGEVADKLVTAVRKHGGIWSHKDLAEYSVVERKPLVTHYRDMKITSLMPPSSGGVAIAQMSLMLEQLDYQHLDSKQRLHAVIEVMRRAYHDRAKYLGDSDYVDVPVQTLISEKHARALLKNYDPDYATPSADLTPVIAGGKKAADTTHFSIIDQYGNRVSATMSINYPFGSCFVAAGTGILLNDEMDDFSSRPGTPNVYGLIGAEANAIAPGKRMLSSMTPSFVETKNRIGVLGTPGGSRIITMVFRAMLDFDQGAGAQQMVDLPRIHHQYLPDKVYYEPGAFNASQVAELKAEHYHLKEMDSTFGNMQVVISDKATGHMQAASDKRGEGEARVISIRQ
jgi:gamma-glutamyltranspeptidase / glutathione hydrolase